MVLSSKGKKVLCWRMAPGTCLVIQWLRLHLPIHGVWVWSLVGELTSHLPHGPKTENIKQVQYCNKLNKDFKKMARIKKKNLKKKKSSHSLRRCYLWSDLGAWDLPWAIRARCPWVTGETWWLEQMEMHEEPLFHHPFVNLFNQNVLSAHPWPCFLLMLGSLCT